MLGRERVDDIAGLGERADEYGSTVCAERGSRGGGTGWWKLTQQGLKVRINCIDDCRIGCHEHHRGVFAMFGFHEQVERRTMGVG